MVLGGFARTAESPAALRREVAANPGAAPAIIVRALQPVADLTARRATEATAAVIQGLGPTPAVSQISSVVYSAVRAVPEFVLEIVRAAAVAAPAEAADEVAAAAVMALPDPWQVTIYRRASTPARLGEPDFKGGPEYKGEPDYKEPGGLPMTLAEAVVHTVLDSRAGTSAPTVYASVEAVLRSAPGWLIAAVFDPKGISGVGEIGTNNYANEPLRPRPPTLAPQPAPEPTPIIVLPRVRPTPPPVSQ